MPYPASRRLHWAGAGPKPRQMRREGRTWGKGPWTRWPPPLHLGLGWSERDHALLEPF